MPLDHTNATAIVSVTGLALGCYNRSTSNWEVGIIRAPRHVLKVIVTKQTPAGPSRMLFQLDEQHRMFVEAENAVIQEEPLFMPMANFDRTATEDVDLEDLRWLVDFENELNGGQPVVLKKPNETVTPLYVSQPRLYADSENRIDHEEAKLIRQADKSEVRPFPRMSQAGKADITCQEGGGVVLRIEGPLGFTCVLPPTPGGPAHEITIDNSCPPPPNTGGSEFSDFALYYKLITDTGGDKFDIKVPHDAEGEGAVCVQGFLGASGQLFPLPS